MYDLQKLQDEYLKARKQAMYWSRLSLKKTGEDYTDSTIATCHSNASLDLADRLGRVIHDNFGVDASEGIREKLLYAGRNDL